ncbi:MAG: hypothetical protein NTY90_05085 [Candidatus Micrarchaeota archaeon]|nr:hypothetical protein [Candidatus Micrarchaeota archaeon]
MTTMGVKPVLCSAFLFLLLGALASAGAPAKTVSVNGYVFADVAAPPGCEGVVPELRLVGATAAVSGGLLKATAGIENPWCVELGQASLEAELVDAGGAVVAKAASPLFAVGAKGKTEEALFFDANGLAPGKYSIRFALSRAGRVGSAAAFLAVPEKSGAGFLAALAGFFRFF